MSRRDFGLFVAAAGLALLVTASAPAFPQTAPAQTAQDSQQGEVDKKQAVEEILRQQDQLMRGQPFSYDPGNRRDPFRSLFEDIQGPKGKGPRPKGVAGMLVAEIDLVGIVKDDNKGDVAFFNGSDNKGYFLHVGDSVYDGKLIAIDARKGIVTFRQQVDDPRVIKPYRDVPKKLVTSEQ